MLNVGFMQGRLCNKVNGKIQAFPWDDWRSEFKLAEKLGFDLLEWTLDFDRLHENPLMTETGQNEIRCLSIEHGVNIRSLTGDCFMQAPFYKANGSFREALLSDFKRVVEASAGVGIKYIVVPLVDNGRLENSSQEESLFEGIQSVLDVLNSQDIFILFESDYEPEALKNLINNYPSNVGVNYDIGNSASLGFDSEHEMLQYGEKILNVHVKDRLLGGVTVPLGEGNANFPTIFSQLKKANYVGDFILQTARANDNDHVAALSRYRKMVESWLT